MPWTDAALPFSGSVPESRHTSYLGAEDAKPRARSQQLRYLEALREYGGLTDREAAKRLKVERTSINARRAPLVEAGIVVAAGTRPGPTGIRNVIWKLAG